MGRVAAGRKRMLAVGFGPSSLSPWAWWDFSDSSTVSVSGSVVTAATDKSGNGRNLNSDGGNPIYVIGGKNGLNYLSAVNAELVNLGISINGMTGVTFAGAFGRPTSNYAVVSAGYSGSGGLRVAENGLGGRPVGSVYYGAEIGPIPQGGWCSIIGSYDCETSAMRNDGCAGSAETSTTYRSTILAGDGIRIGRIFPDYYPIEVGELIILPRALSSGELAALGTYLAEKWGTA